MIQGLTCSPATWTHVALVVSPLDQESGDCRKSLHTIYINGKPLFNFFAPHCLSKVSGPPLASPQTPPMIGMDTLEHRPFVGRMSVFVVRLPFSSHTQLSERAFTDALVASLAGMRGELSAAMQAACNGVYFASSSFPLRESQAPSATQSKSEMAVESKSKSEMAVETQPATPVEKQPDAQTESKPDAQTESRYATYTSRAIPATELLQAYLQKPDHFSPPTTNLRGSHTLPPPPPEKDELCRHELPAPLPALSGALKEFVDSLHRRTLSEHDAIARGEAAFSVPPEVAEDYHNLNEYRAQSVRQAFCFAWAWYKERAWGADEVRPVSGTATNRWGNMAMNVVDSVDTILLLGLHKEEAEARKVVRDVRFDSPKPTSMFETTIRVLGGTLAAYQYTKDRVYLEKAKDVGERMLPAFSTPSGYPKVSTAR